MNKNTKRLVTLTKEKEEMLNAMMVEDCEIDEPISSYIARMVSKEWKRRQDEKARETEKRGPGRPRKDDNYTDDEQVVCKPEEPIYPHPDQIMNAGMMLTKTELEAYQMFKAGMLQSV